MFDDSIGDLLGFNARTLLEENILLPNPVDILSFDKIFIQTDKARELKFPQQYENKGIIILDDLKEKEMNDSRVQAMFKRSRHNNLSIFIVSQELYELPKKTIRANRNIYHIFKPNNFLDVCKVYQDEARMDMTLDEIKHLTSTCWDEEFQTLTIDMTKDKYTGRYQLGLNNLFVPNTNPF